MSARPKLLSVGPVKPSRHKGMIFVSDYSPEEKGPCERPRVSLERHPTFVTPGWPLPQSYEQQRP